MVPKLRRPTAESDGRDGSCHEVSLNNPTKPSPLVRV